MKHHFFRSIVFFIFALHVSAQETILREVFDTKTDTHVEVLGLFSKLSPSGYHPVRVKLANNLSSDRTVNLSFDSNQSYGNRLQCKSSFSFAAGAGKTVIRDIMVPICPGGQGYGSNSLQVRMTGTLGSANTQIYSNSSGNAHAVLLSEALFTRNASSLDAEISSRGSSGYSSSSEFGSKFDPKQLPDDWLAYSGYDSLILTDDDWTAIPPGARNAILSWMRLGGQIIVYSLSSSTLSSLGFPDDYGYGSVEITSAPSSHLLNANEVVDRVIANKNKPIQSAINNDYRSSWPLQKHFGEQTFRYALFILVLVIFGILVGPVNLFVFAKSGQRHKLFITTPLISLAASMILILLIIVQDGFGGNGMRRVLMEVRPDGDVNAAYLHQEQFCRTGVLTGSRFTLETPATFVPVPIASSRWARYTDGTGALGSFNLQPADGKIEASGDWYKSRSEHGHALSAVVPTRGRIESTDVANTCISTFDFPIETLYFLDANQQWHRADGITAGKRFTFTPLDATMALPNLNKEANAFTERNRQILERAKQRTGHFIAVTSAAPGLATSPNIRWNETRTVITGPIVNP